MPLMSSQSTDKPVGLLLQRLAEQLAKDDDVELTQLNTMYASIPHDCYEQNIPDLNRECLQFTTVGCRAQRATTQAANLRRRLVAAVRWVSLAWPVN